MQAVDLQEVLSALRQKSGPRVETQVLEWQEVKVADREETVKLKGVEIMLVCENDRVSRIRFNDGENVFTLTFTIYEGMKLLVPKEHVSDVWHVTGNPLPELVPPVDLIFGDEMSAARHVKAWEERGFSLDSEKKSMGSKEVAARARAQAERG